jgi:hypothetical protein
VRDAITEETHRRQGAALTVIFFMASILVLLCVTASTSIVGISVESGHAHNTCTQLRDWTRAL